MKQLPLYEQIYNDIIEGIENGTYKKGDRLPSEKELSEKYCVSRITSKKALELLAEEGKLKLLHFPVERYDAQTMEHPHFYCTQCGCVSDLDLQYGGQLDQRAEAECGVTVEWHDLFFYGTCQLCKLKGKEPTEG